MTKSNKNIKLDKMREKARAEFDVFLQNNDFAEAYEDAFEDWFLETFQKGLDFLQEQEYNVNKDGEVGKKLITLLDFFKQQEYNECKDENLIKVQSMLNKFRSKSYNKKTLRTLIKQTLLYDQEFPYEQQQETS